MKKSIGKNIITFFFLSTFLLLRIGNLHVFSHVSEDDKVHCELCEVIVATNDITPFTNSTFEIQLQRPDIYVSRLDASFRYELSNFSITLPEIIRNRPPPFTSIG